MSNIQTIEENIAQLEERIQPLLKQLEELREDLRRAKSQAWIDAYGVRLEEVMGPDDDEGMPWFGDVDSFMRYVESLTPALRKKYVSWNGVIDFTNDALGRGFNLRSPGRVSELKPQ